MEVKTKSWKKLYIFTQFSTVEGQIVSAVGWGKTQHLGIYEATVVWVRFARSKMQQTHVIPRPIHVARVDAKMHKANIKLHFSSE